MSDGCPDDDVVQATGCVMCETLLGWVSDLWPDGPEAAPDFRARDAGQLLRLKADSGEISDPAPFCDTCARLFMAALQQYRKDQLAREGTPAVVPARPAILTPGQPGFRAPSR